MKIRPFCVPGILLCSLFSSAAFAAEAAPVKRLTYALDALKVAYGGRTDYENMLEMGKEKVPGTNEQVRSFLFRIESLFDLYKKRYPELKAEVAIVKNLEDHIGHYEDARDFYNKSKESGNADYIAQKRAAYQAERAQYLADLHNWATSGGSPAVERLRDVVQRTFGALDEEQDRQFLLERMIKYVDDLAEKDYDMTKLESGIHKLRRDVRDMDYYPYAMGGAIVWDAAGAKAPCPGEAVAAGLNNGTKPKMVEIIAPVEKTCYLSACLGARVSAIQSQLAVIKQEGALQGAASAQDADFAPKATIRKATPLYEELRGKGGRPNLLGLIKSQLEACR